jgi:hypothetical protein
MISIQISLGPSIILEYQVLLHTRERRIWPFHSQGPGHPGNPAPGCAIGNHIGQADKARQGCRVDDFSIALTDHDPAHCLGHDKGRLQIEIHHSIPILNGNILGGSTNIPSGIIDQDIDSAEFG